MSTEQWWYDCDRKAEVLCLPQIPHGLAWDRDRALLLTGRGLTDRARHGRNI
jgi:hypothetical protein